MAKQTAYRRVPALRAFIDAHQKTVVDQYAKRAGTTGEYLMQLANGHRQASWHLAQRIAREIPGVTPTDLRPDIFSVACADGQPAA